MLLKSHCQNETPESGEDATRAVQLPAVLDEAVVLLGGVPPPPTYGRSDANGFAALGPIPTLPTYHRRLLRTAPLL